MKLYIKARIIACCIIFFLHSAYSLTQQKVSEIKGFSFQVAPGIGMDFQRTQNNYLKKPLFTLTSGMDYTFWNNHLIGLEYLADIQNIKEDEVTNYMEQDTAHHRNLISITKGYNNTFQFGLHYGYIFTFKGNLSLRGTIGIGKVWNSKNPFTVEYKPIDTSLYSFKRFTTRKSHLETDAWGNYTSVKVDVLFPLKSEGYLFAGMTYVYSNLTINNVYAEEYDYNGNNIFTFYSESTKIRRMDFHIGLMIRMN